MAVVKPMRMAIEFHDQLTMSAMRNLGAQFLKRGFYDPWIDIIADRMRKQRVQGRAMSMVHAMIPLRSILEN